LPAKLEFISLFCFHSSDVHKNSIAIFGKFYYNRLKHRKGNCFMKKIVCLFIAVALLLGLCACGGSGESGGKDYKGLQVGFGRTSIVPDVLGVEIAGGDASARISTGYRDEVSATCIAIKEGEETILLYTLDFIVVDQHVYAAQPEIAEATGIPVENILLNCTHTHSGVSIRSNWDNGQHDAYRAKYRAAAVEAAQIALADLSPAEMYYGSTMTENLVFVRHYLLENGTTYGNGHGTTSGTSIKEHLYPSDGELQVIKFARPAEDKKDVVLLNLGAHATMMNAIDANMISADWPYNARSYVEYVVGEDGLPDTEQPRDYLCAVFEAAAGDQIPNSNIKAIAPYGNKYPEFGNKVGEYCMSVLEGEMTKAPGSGISLKVHNYTAPSMKEGLEDPERFAQAQEVASISAAKGSSHMDTKAAVSKYGFPSVYEATGLVSRSKYPETFSMELHYMDIDGVSFIFAPFEMFGVTGREIKDNSPYDMTFVITCSENKGGYHMGYLPHEYGCEESFYEYDVTKFARGTAEDLAKTYVNLLTELKGAE